MNQHVAVVDCDMRFAEPDIRSNLPALERLAVDSLLIAAALRQGRPMAFTQWDDCVANLPLLARAAPSAGYFGNVPEAAGFGARDMRNFTHVSELLVRRR